MKINGRTDVVHFWASARGPVCRSCPWPARCGCRSVTGALGRAGPGLQLCSLPQWSRLPQAGAFPPTRVAQPACPLLQKPAGAPAGSVLGPQIFRENRQVDMSTVASLPSLQVHEHGTSCFLKSAFKVLLISLSNI